MQAIREIVQTLEKQSKAMQPIDVIITLDLD
jgi:hypothetical protein